MERKFYFISKDMKKRDFVLYGVLSFGIIYGVLKEHKRLTSVIEEKIKRGDRFQNLYQLMLSWIGLYQENRTFDEYFSWIGIQHIAIYGNGVVGQKFVKEMDGLKTKVDYIIDKKGDAMISTIPVFTLQQELPPVDAIVVTVLDQFDQISEEIQKKYNYSVIPLDDVVYGSNLH